VNIYAFFALYANVDGFSYAEPSRTRGRASGNRPLDPLGAAFNVGRYTVQMDTYDVTKAARSVSEFTIDQLSNWYVRRNRRRFWKSDRGSDKTAAYQTLYECLDAVAKTFGAVRTLPGRGAVPEPECRLSPRALPVGAPGRDAGKAIPR